ncbi:MAG: amidohydrolase family protein [Phycisphaerales bacterium]|nr:amidohydrolase family protein [Phycisphaerales bacterium]
MSRTLIYNVEVVEPGIRVGPGSVLIDGRKIVRLIRDEDAQVEADERIDGGGRVLSPGLMDVHTHGIHQAIYENPGDFQAAAEACARHGTTCVLPTLYKVMSRKSLGLLRELTAAMKGVTACSYPGYHLEGPFLALPGAGAETLPGDVGLMAEVYEACEGRVSAVSISPDSKNIIPVIEWLMERDVVPFITHTAATPEQTQQAIDAGARHATHFYDVFPVPPVREPGVRPCGAVETILADRRCTVDFVCDGVHVEPIAIKAAIAAKGYEGVLLTTDSNIGAGMPEGVYETPWGYKVRVRDGDGARHAEQGFLAGSALTMDRGMANLFRWLQLPAEQVWAMGTSNVAKMLGLKHKGVIRAGADADLVLWNENFNVARTWVAGKCVYQA